MSPRLARCSYTCDHVLDDPAGRVNVLLRGCVDAAPPVTGRRSSADAIVRR